MACEDDDEEREEEGEDEGKEGGNLKEEQGGSGINNSAAVPNAKDGGDGCECRGREKRRRASGAELTRTRLWGQDHVLLVLGRSQGSFSRFSACSQS